MTEDVVTLRYNLHALGDIPYGILTVKNKLLATRAKLFSDDEHMTDQFDHVTDILIRINLIMNEYGGPPPARALRRGRRVRRGLFDAAGILSKALFGTATEKDVDALKAKVSALAGLETRNTRTMRLVYKHFTKVETTMLDITKKTNQLLVLSQNYTRELAELWN
ncbi:MAG: hypothetical protein GY938_07755, partial [Ketobacter sp.]|nr:hypothetical protein [Ketobacter sp.]